MRLSGAWFSGARFEVIMANSQNKAGLAGSFADDEAALKRGKGGVVGVLAVIAVLGAVGLWFLMGKGDDVRVYSELGKQLNGLKQAHFDQFLGCALAGANLASIKSNTDLTSQFEGRARERGQNYGIYLRDKCAGKLKEIEPTLDTLIVPDDLKGPVNEMKASTSKLRAGVGGLISYLDNPELHYDETAAGVYLQNITLGWFEFRKAYGDTNKVLKARLEQH
jgi:hypothetical protein